MNHHRIIGLRRGDKQTTNSNNNQPSETIDFNEQHVCSKFVNLLQHNVELLCRISQQLFLDNKFDESVRFGFHVLQQIFNPLSSSIELTTSYLLSCHQIKNKQQLFTTVPWDPSKTPLFACKVRARRKR